jgi:hypothetical protein
MLPMSPIRLLAAFALAAAVPTLAAAAIETRTVQFAKGASSATVKGSIKGDHTVDYTVRARAGQTMAVDLQSRHTALAFNVLPPGSNDVAIPDAISRQAWSGALPADGEYKVRVYLPRSSARRGETASYTLTVGIDAGAGSAAGQGSDSRALAATRRAGEGRFDATGMVPCAQQSGQPLGQCNFGVARAGGGTATVAVTRPDGRKRFIFFESGRAVGADLSQADGNMTFRATRQGDLNMIQAGDERYEIPDAAVFGG